MIDFDSEIGVFEVRRVIGIQCVGHLIDRFGQLTAGPAPRDGQVDGAI